MGAILFLCMPGAVEITVESPSGRAGERLQGLRLRPGEDAVIRLNDCIDESYALQVPAA